MEMLISENEDELAVLAHLHDAAEGFGGSQWVERETIADGTGMDMPRLIRAASFLAERGLVGVDRSVVTFGGPAIGFVYLTGRGEACMRKLSRRLQADGVLPKGSRLGLAALKAAGDATVRVAAGVMTELAKGRAR